MCACQWDLGAAFRAIEGVSGAADVSVSALPLLTDSWKSSRAQASRRSRFWARAQRGRNQRRRLFSCHEIAERERLGAGMRDRS